MTAKKTIGDAFGGQFTTLEEQRAHLARRAPRGRDLGRPDLRDADLRDRPRSDRRFMELLLSVVPRFSTAVVGFYPTSDPETIIIESHGGGPTVAGGRYTQRYFSLVTTQERAGVPHARVLQPVPDLQGVRQGALGARDRRDHDEVQQALARVAAARSRSRCRRRASRLRRACPGGRRSARRRRAAARGSSAE